MAVYRAALLIPTLVVIATLLQPRTWTAQASFISRSNKASAGGLGGLAAQFGVALPLDGSGESPKFYVDLLKSRPVLQSLLRANVSAGPEQAPKQSVQHWLTDGDTSASAAQAALISLRGLVETEVDEETGKISVRVTTENPEFSFEIVRRLLSLLEQFNQETRKTQASAERQFTERRLREAGLELKAAEERLESFVQRNREYVNSPRLRLLQERLTREVSLRLQLYSTVADAYEKARIEEVRDTPVLTVIEPPEPVRVPDRRRLLTKLVLGLLAGLAVGLLVVFAREFAGYLETQDALVPGLGLKDAVRQDLASPFRTIQRVIRSAGPKTR
jgi:uncharacterized protein involved in exopolysaccharide biosynthesis